LYWAMRSGRLTVGRVVPSRVCRTPRRPNGPVTTVVPVEYVVAAPVWVLACDCHGARSRVDPNLMCILAPRVHAVHDSNRAVGFRQTWLSHISVIKHVDSIGRKSTHAVFERRTTRWNSTTVES